MYIVSKIVLLKNVANKASGSNNVCTIRIDIRKLHGLNNLVTNPNWCKVDNVHLSKMCISLTVVSEPHIKKLASFGRMKYFSEYPNTVSIN